MEHLAPSMSEKQNMGSNKLASYLVKPSLGTTTAEFVLVLVLVCAYLGNYYPHLCFSVVRIV